MAIQDFTKYLGASVKFDFKPFPNHPSLGDFVDTIEGVIEEVVLTKYLQDSQFLVDDTFYSFNSIDFDSVEFVDIE